MKLVRPTTITDSHIVSLNVPETDYTEYSALTTYAAGGRCIVVAEHKIYESLQAGNVGHNPPDNLSGNSPWWMEVGATNAWKMLDGKVGTQTENADSIEIVLEIGRINTVGLLQLDCNSVTVKLSIGTGGSGEGATMQGDPIEIQGDQIEIAGATTVFQETKSAVVNNVSNWYQYFYEPIYRKSDLVFIDIPPVNGTLTITIEAAGGIAKCGVLVVGYYKSLGTMLWGPEFGITDYSVKSTDDFGAITAVERGYSKKLSVPLWIAAGGSDEVARLVPLYRATPVLWVGDADVAMTIIYGFFTDFSIVMPGPAGDECSLEIEGMV